jgi:hypothetical protein
MESEYMIIYDAAMDNFESILEKTIYGNNVFAAIQVTNFGPKYLLNYSTIFIPFEEVSEELKSKEYSNNIYSFINLFRISKEIQSLCSYVCEKSKSDQKFGIQ